jgi:hypothetical protein
MIKSNTSPACPALRRVALLSLGCALALVATQFCALRAADAPASQSAADKAPSLPLVPTFEKVTSGENGPYALNLKNVSKDAVTVSAQVIASVTFHATAKTRNLPEHAIEAGQVWTITELAATDKVIISGKGFAPLELTVP